MNTEHSESRRGLAAGLTSEQLAVMQTFDTTVLSAVARGLLDLNRLAVEQLADRGLDPEGKWIGFGEARKSHGLESTAPQRPL